MRGSYIGSLKQFICLHVETGLIEFEGCCPFSLKKHISVG
jgi:hypothetical protein